MSDDERFEQLYTAEEVAEIGKVSRETVWRWMRMGKLRWIWFGTEKRIPESAIREIVRPAHEGYGEDTSPTNKLVPDVVG